MHHINPSQTIDNGNGRDTALQISEEGQGSEGRKAPRPNVAREVKALNGTRGRGVYFVAIKLDREWNEIRVRLTDGRKKVAAETFIDLGHTAESRAGAVDELRATVRHLAAL